MQLNSEVAKKFKLYDVVTFEDYKEDHKVETANQHSICLDQVEPQVVRWLWLNRIPLGKLTMISGDPGLGKSMLTSYLAAQITTGKAFPGELLAYGETKDIGSVIMLSAEDDIADTILPRVNAAGADVSKVRVMNTVIKEQHRHRGLDITKDVSSIEGVINGFGDCKLITIDPISSFMGRVDSNSNSEVRGALAPITNLAQKYGIAVVCISHLNKGSGKAMYRTMGSLAFTAAARAAFAIAKDEEDEEVRYFCEIKNNLAKNSPPLSYTVSYSNDHCAPYLVWGDQVIDKTTEEIMETTSAASKKDKVISYVTDLLADGPMAVDEVRQACENKGLSYDTFRAYKKSARVESYRPGGNGPWLVKLSE